jgi:hypothetical protein
VSKPQGERTMSMIVHSPGSGDVVSGTGRFVVDCTVTQ